MEVLWFHFYYLSKIRKQQRKIKGLACRHLLASELLYEYVFMAHLLCKNSHNSHSPVFGRHKLTFPLLPILPLPSHDEIHGQPLPSTSTAENYNGGGVYPHPATKAVLFM